MNEDAGLIAISENRMGPRFCPQFRKDDPHVRFDGAARDGELAGDLLIRAPAPDEPDDFHLARGEYAAGFHFGGK